MTRKPKKTPIKRAGEGIDMHSATKSVTRAIVVHIEPKSRKEPAARDAEARLAEAIGLTQAIELEITESVIVNLAKPRPSTLIGEGKVKEIAAQIEANDVEVAIVNAQLTPIQQRNLERDWKTKVLDRTGLILEIFGRRASTREGTMQVELAHLQYQKSRLVRSWTHLERQRGGFGFLGGPGESQLEADRRLIQERIAKIESELENVVKTRSLHRQGRARVPYPIVALVGYTNAGKSTLFNRLTDAKVLAKDMLFATLDPTMRVITLPKGRKIILSDTVGFISELPTTLVAAFRATLEEVLSAQVILHVRDISHSESDAQAADVYKVLAHLGLDDTARDHLLEVWNKSDLLDPLDLVKREAELSRKEDSYLVSSLDGSGVAALLKAVETMLAQGATTYKIKLGASDGKEQAWLHERGEVLAKRVMRTGDIEFHVRLNDDRAGQAAARFGKLMKVVK